MKYTPVRIEKYLKYIDGYGYQLYTKDSYLNAEYNYDFETEQMLVEKCEAGEMLSINDLTPREHE